MNKAFDDLFNEFFNRKRNNQSSINEEVKKIIESLMNYKKSQVEKFDEAIEEELGEPDEIIDHVRDGMNFRKMIWYTPHGNFVKIIVTDIEPDPVPTPPEPTPDPFANRKKHSKSLEQRLKEAVEAEDYELAIVIRDEIKRNKRKSRKKKTNE